MTGPLDAYADLVARGAVLSDPAQRLAIEKLEILHQRLGLWSPPARAARGLFGWLSGRIRSHEEPPQGLYIYGGVGRGKSMLMDLFFRGAPVESKRRVHFHAFMQEVHAAIFAHRQLSEEERARRGGDDPIPVVAGDIAAGARLLCFDEFQVTDVADAMILGRLFTALWAENVVVVATSNRAPRELYEGGLNRQLFLPFIKTLEETLDVLHLDGARDWRMERLAGHTVYFSPLGPTATQALDEAFGDLTRGSEAPDFTLEVLGRQVTIPHAAYGVARASFADLCRAALGPADYLALARQFHTLVLDEIPLLGPENRNEAKRFVILIDALYEAQAKLICSAAAPAEALYPTGDGAFEFKRTVSRLNEMQSDDYLKRGHGV
ncbi:cell division protein ZapE [Oleomonas cavernae]|uniref:Cell division protein ZapE n=1 Tax=Oleomonas cavernae TaxID=2320859 RepID=A0A418WF69_9PROT|nr:cell division protein ZapE [Oleomonas cavernae]RJF88678.1 cell division protein ZapE [Oleomonas cavernae]